MILRARLLVSMDGPPLEDAGVRVRGGRIEAVGPFAELRREFGADPVEDLGEQALFPGLINAHCHLDYTGLRGAIPPQADFPAWIGRINALKATLTETDYLAAIAQGFAELRRWGTTAVCNLEAFPELLGRVATPPIRAWWLAELIDIRDPAAAPALVDRAEAAFGLVPGALNQYGFSPHAPFTASPALYRRCAQRAAERGGFLLSTHLAESAGEAAMFREATGPLYDFLKRIGRPMDDCGGGTAFGNLVGSGLVGPGWLIAHANELEEEDFDWIAAHPGPWHFVHCPRSHAFFRHRPFAWRRLQSLGANLCIGTDSLASNDGLDLFGELRAAARGSAAGLTSEQLMETVTLAPARALGKAGELGVAAPGAHADLIALPHTGSPDEIYDALVANTRPIEWMMVDGKRA